MRPLPLHTSVMRKSVTQPSDVHLGSDRDGSHSVKGGGCGNSSCEHRPPAMPTHAHAATVHSARRAERRSRPARRRPPPIYRAAPQRRLGARGPRPLWPSSASPPPLPGPHHLQLPCPPRRILVRRILEFRGRNSVDPPRGPAGDHIPSIPVSHSQSQAKARGRRRTHGVRVGSADSFPDG